MGKKIEHRTLNIERRRGTRTSPVSQLHPVRQSGMTSHGVKTASHGPGERRGREGDRQDARPALEGFALTLALTVRKGGSGNVRAPTQQRPTEKDEDDDDEDGVRPTEKEAAVGVPAGPMKMQHFHGGIMAEK